MPTRTADARWEGTLKEGSGRVKLGSGAFDGEYNFVSRFEAGGATNPEELLGAAHAGCFSMALNNALDKAGTPAKYIRTTASVHLTKGEAGMEVSKIDLATEEEVPGIDAEKFNQFAQDTLKGCIVS